MGEGFTCVHAIPNSDPNCLNPLANVAHTLSLGSIVVVIVAILLARRHERRTIWTALRLEVEAIRSIANEGLVNKAAQNVTHVWTQLPASTVDQAIHEATLLRLSGDDIKALQDLRAPLASANTYIRDYFNIILARSHAGMGYSQANMNGGNDMVRDRLHEVVAVCATATARFGNRWIPAHWRGQL